MLSRIESVKNKTKEQRIMVKKGIVKFSKIVATFTMVLAVVSVNATCFFFHISQISQTH